jgi:hypothetical protein
MFTDATQYKYINILQNPQFFFIDAFSKIHLQNSKLEMHSKKQRVGHTIVLKKTIIYYIFTYGL